MLAFSVQRFHARIQQASKHIRMITVVQVMGHIYTAYTYLRYSIRIQHTCTIGILILASYIKQTEEVIMVGEAITIHIHIFLPNKLVCLYWHQSHTHTHTPGKIDGIA